MNRYIFNMHSYVKKIFPLTKEIMKSFNCLSYLSKHK